MGVRRRWYVEVPSSTCFVVDRQGWRRVEARAGTLESFEVTCSGTIRDRVDPERKTSFTMDV